MQRLDYFWKKDLKEMCVLQNNYVVVSHNICSTVYLNVITVKIIYLSAFSNISHAYVQLMDPACDRFHSN